MADATWKKLKDKVTTKRGKKRDAEDTMYKLLKGNELTVQRLSSKVSGKAQKYARIGPREFVPFTEDEITIENVKRCCERHFATQVGTSLICDILAGEQGQDCETLGQIPDMKIPGMKPSGSRSPVHDIMHSIASDVKIVFLPYFLAHSTRTIPNKSSRTFQLLLHCIFD